MRRSLVPSSLVLAAAAMAAIWILAIAGPATARPAQIACPVSGAQPATCCPLAPGAKTRRLAPVCCGNPVCCSTTPCCTGIDCCPAPASGTATTPSTCCTTTPCPSGSITIAASPDPSTAGQKVVISGSMVGTPVAGTQVVLWRKLAGQSSFQQLAQTTTDGSGNYSFTMTPGTVMADQAWYVSASGMQSSTVQQQVAAVVAVASSARSIAVGHAIVLRGHVTPSHAGQVVLIEVKRGGAWRVLARPRLGHGSTYSVSHRFARAGADALRVVLPGDSQNARSTSRTVTVTVTG